MNSEANTPVLNKQCLNKFVADGKKSATLAINERSIQLQSEGKKIYRFGLGQSPFPVPKSVVKKLEESAPEKDYLAVCGLKKLREQIASWLNRYEGTSFTGEDVLISPGSKELLFMAGLALDSALLAETPCWVSYLPQAKFLGK